MTGEPATCVVLDLMLPECLTFVSLRHTMRTGEYELCLGATDPAAWPDLMVRSIRGTDLPVMAAELTTDLRTRLEELLAERAASRKRSAGDRWPAPDPRYPPDLQRPPAASLGVTPRSQSVGRGAGPRGAATAPIVTGWTDSVPRQAAEWHRASDGSVRVVLRPGLYYADGSTEKVHRTVRMAKDETRAATAGYQETLV